MKISFDNPHIYIPSGALSIKFNALGEARLVSASASAGSVIKVYYSGTTYEDIRRDLGVDVDGVSYRSFLLTAHDTVLSDSGQTIFIYAHVNTDGTALLTFTAMQPWHEDIKALTDTFYAQVDAEGKEHAKCSLKLDSVKYEWDVASDTGGEWWVYIGYATFNSSTGIYNDSQVDLGKLGTDIGIKTEELGGGAILFDNTTNKISLGEGWSFSSVISDSVNAVTAVFSKSITLAGRIISKVLNSSDAATDKDDEHVVSSGWLLGKWLPTFLTTLASKFLSKEHDDSTPYKLSMASADVKGDASIGNKLSADSAEVSTSTKTNTLNVDTTATIGTTLTARQQVTSPIHTTDSFTQNELLGQGAQVWEDSDKFGHVETDYLAVRKAAWFRSITIEEVKHVGGELILSAAACVLSRVQGRGDRHEVYYDSGDPSLNSEEAKSGEFSYFRCYFEKTANGREAYNEWQVGDQARCQEFHPSVGTSEDVRTQYYWRLVIAVGEETLTDADGISTEYYYIDLSNSEGTVIIGDDYEPGKGADTGSTMPQPNDSVVLLGHRGKTDLYRRSAQVYSTAELNSPSRRFYQDIKSFSLSSDNEIETLEWNSKQAHTRWHVGTTDEYILFDKNGLEIRAKKIFMSTGKTIEETIAEMGGEITEVFLLTEAEGSPTPRIENNGTLVSGPLSPWDWTADQYQSHDHAVCVTSQGLCYRWSNHPTHGWIWLSVSDKYLVDALQRTEALESTMSSITEDGVVLPGEKQTIIRLRDAITQQKYDVDDIYNVLSELDVDHNRSEFSDAYDSYCSSYEALSLDYERILEDPSPVVEVPSGMNAHLENYLSAYAAIQKLVNKANGSIFKQTADMTEIGNKFFKKNDDGEWVTSENKLVTGETFAGLFSTQVTSQGIAKQAYVQTSVENGIAAAQIGADQIQLNGFISANERFFVDKDANLYAEQGVFGGLVRNDYKVICAGNKYQYGYDSRKDTSLDSVDFFVIDVCKAGSYFMVYEAEQSGGAEDPHAFDSGGVRSVYGPICPYLRIKLPCFTKISTDLYPMTWRDAYDLTEARKYVGTKIRVLMKTTGVGTLEFDGGRRYAGGTYGADNYTKTTAIGGILYKLECVTAMEQGYEHIFWRVEESMDFTTPMYDGHALWFLPFYHWEGDYLRHLEVEHVVRPQDKYVLHDRWQRIQSMHLALSKDKDLIEANGGTASGSAWSTYLLRFSALRVSINLERPVLTEEIPAPQRSQGLFQSMNYSTSLAAADMLPTVWDNYYAAYDALTK